MAELVYAQAAPTLAQPWSSSFRSGTRTPESVT